MGLLRNLVDAGRVAGTIGLRAGRRAAALAAKQPPVRRQVDRFQEQWAEARVTVEAQLKDVESELWAWVQRLQSKAQKAARQAERRRVAADHYALLGIQPGADLKAVKVAWRAKMREHHPDRFAGDPNAEAQAHAQAQRINAAYEELTALLSGRENRRAD